LRRVHPQTGNFGQPLDGILMLAKEAGDLLVQLADLLLDQVQLLQRHSHQSAVDGVEIAAGTQRVPQLCRRGTQALIGQSGYSKGSVSPSAIAFSIRRALAPNRSETKLDNLIWASSSSASS
jgi:hypothetical protein